MPGHGKWITFLALDVRITPLVRVEMIAGRRIGLDADLMI